MNKKNTMPEKTKLDQVGMKITTARARILEILEKEVKNDVTQNHLSTEDIYRLLLAQNADVGIATVYRVLSQFENAGLVVRHHFESGYAVYELARESHHDHMICLEDGKVIEFCNDEIERIQKEIAHKAGYELVDHSLVLYVRHRK